MLSGEQDQLPWLQWPFWGLLSLLVSSQRHLYHKLVITSLTMLSSLVNTDFLKTTTTTTKETKTKHKQCPPHNLMAKAYQISLHLIPLYPSCFRVDQVFRSFCWTDEPQWYVMLPTGSRHCKCSLSHALRVALYIIFTSCSNCCLEWGSPRLQVSDSVNLTAVLPGLWNKLLARNTLARHTPFKV